MNLLVICSDTFRADYLGCYGNNFIQTPYLDYLADRSVVFTDMYGEGLPTLQGRTVFWTGHRIIPIWRVKRWGRGIDWHLSQQPGWHPLDESETTISEVLGNNGYTTALITDTVPMMRPGCNFNRGFDSWQWIRGQIIDDYITGPREKVNLTPYVRNVKDVDRRFKPGSLEKYLLNVMHRSSEEDYFVAQVMRTASEWLKDNINNKPFFLWVDCFDPHEPWDPPKEYANRYYPNYQGIEFIHAPRFQVEYYSENEFQRIKALYAGEVTLVDKWVGHLLMRVNDLDLWDDTVIVFLSDHGTILGEHGFLRKQHNLLIKPETRLPLIMYHPDQQFAGKKVKGFVQAQDVMPTLLGLLDISLPAKADGKNAWGLVTDKTKKLYDHVVSGYGNHVSIRNQYWNYITSYIQSNGTAKSIWGGSLCQLYDLTADPKEENNVVEKHPEVVEVMKNRLRDYGVHLLE